VLFRSRLQLEVTESFLVSQPERAKRILEALRSRGILIALDDFGTGFSSMSYLKRLPVSTIKIDRAFVDGMEEGADSEAIVAAIIAMSHALGKSVIAEGVETELQERLLRKLGCDEAQGFLYSQALPVGEFAALVRSRGAVPLPA